MAIRIRKINKKLVALCATKFTSKDGDIYLDDNIHHALALKFKKDFESEGVNFKNQVSITMCCDCTFKYGSINCVGCDYYSN